MNKPAYHHGDLRKALLEAAEAELAESDIEGFSLRGVAKRAGVSHAAPAHHFKDTSAMLTALAATGFERFADEMAARQRQAPQDAKSQYIAMGLGYINFALENPALFKLMFGSTRPDVEDAELDRNGTVAFMMLVDALDALHGSDPLTHEGGLLDLAASWSLVHGLATLLIAGRAKFLQPLLEKDRDAALTIILERSLPAFEAG